MAHARAGAWIVGVVLLGLAGGAGWWAGQAAVPNTPVAAPVERVTATVTEGSVGRTLPYSVTVRQSWRVAASNTLAGTVTQALASGATVGVGDAIYTVGGTPVRAITGDTPLWRDLAVGVSGADVTELQQALTTLGFYSGVVDGKFRASTRDAVSRWQAAVGQERTGQVVLGTVVALPALPTGIRLKEQIAVGLTVTGGEPSVLVPDGAPTFWIDLTQDAAQRVPQGSVVEITGPQATWTGTTGAGVIDQVNTSSVSIPVTGPDGASPCGQDCTGIPVGDAVYLQAQVQVEAQAAGPAVPAAAVQSDADGATWVQLASGERRDVTVRGSSSGMAVVDGVEVGDEVLVRAGDE